MDIWIVSLFDPTPVDNTQHGRYINIASAGFKLGHNITHFTCTFRHSEKVQRFSQTHIKTINGNYRVVYIFAGSYKKNISLKRFLSHSEFTRNLKGFLVNQSPPDVILIAFPPISPSFFLTKWAKKKRIPIVIDIIDLWPDDFKWLIPKQLRPLLKLFLYPMYFKVYRIFKRCSGVIGISNEYISWAKSYSSLINRTKVFFPSVPYQIIRKKIEQLDGPDKKRGDKLRLIYAGSLGITYDIPVILKAAEQIEKKHPGMTEFIFAGAGHYKDLMLDYIDKYANIKYLGRLDHNDLIIQYASSDLGLAQYPVNATQSVTYKFFDYLSSGLPILNSLMTEMATLTEQYQVGLNNPPGNVNRLVLNIERFLFDRSLLNKFKQNSLKLAAEKGDSEFIYKDLIDFLLSFK
jgi:glycosyltransferase involved in cell wall biosynthesis